MDGTPSLGLLPLNIIFASDAVVVPVLRRKSRILPRPCPWRSVQRISRRPCIRLSAMTLLPDILFCLPGSPPRKLPHWVASFVLEQIRKTFSTDRGAVGDPKHEAVVSNLSLMRRTVFDVTQAMPT